MTEENQSRVGSGGSLERLLFPSKPWLKKKASDSITWATHPNTITSFGALLSISGAYHLMNNHTDPSFGSGITSLGLVISGSIMDGLDGYVAKKFDKVTKEGATYDAFIDKVSDVFLFSSMNYIVGSELGLFDPFFIFSATATSLYLASHYPSQFNKERGQLKEQIEKYSKMFFNTEVCEKIENNSSKKNEKSMATKYGKTKTILAKSTTIGFTFNEAFPIIDNPEYIGLALGASALGALVLSYKSIKSRA